jgi:hypothetical protein
MAAQPDWGRKAVKLKILGRQVVSRIDNREPVAKLAPKQVLHLVAVKTLCRVRRHPCRKRKEHIARILQASRKIPQQGTNSAKVWLHQIRVYQQIELCAQTVAGRPGA